MRRLALLTVTLILLPAAAATTPFVADVVGGDADYGIAIQSHRVSVSYIDANGSGHVDIANPREPVYLDMDASGSVSYGDLRLTAFANYPANTRVDVANDDAGRTLASAAGWLAHGASGWVADVDNSGTLSVADIRFLADGPAQVLQGATGEALATQGTSQTLATAQDPAIMYLDVDQNTGGGGRVTPGDVRIALGPLGSDVPAQPAVTTTTTVTQGGAASAAPAASKAVPDSWRPLDWILVALAVANLGGLALLARAQRPKNPFT